MGFTIGAPQLDSAVAFGSSGLLDYTDVGEPDIADCWIPMSTAIARIYTKDGFVVAADGRESSGSGATLKVISDSVQKIFSVDQTERCLAYTIAGTIRLTQIDSGDTLFDFVAETAKAMQEMELSNDRYLLRFAESLRDKLITGVCEAKEKRTHRVNCDFPESSSETHIFLDGYYRRLPKRAHIVFRHFGIAQSETEEEVNTCQLHEGHGYGSRVLLELLNQENILLANLRPTKITKDLTLSEAITVAHNRVRAHFGSLAKQLDANCSNMGGHIHMATITLANGFQWVEGFEPIKPCVSVRV